MASFTQTFEVTEVVVAVIEIFVVCEHGFFLTPVALITVGFTRNAGVVAP
jgi:hypothetical protein